MNRAYYSDSISNFIISNNDEIIGKLALRNKFSLEQSQRDAWLEEISILKEILPSYNGSVYFEYSIPRMGQRIDVVIIIKSVIFVLEFKVGEKEFNSYAINQVWDYALDLKNFHETSHEQYIAPILIPTKAKRRDTIVAPNINHDKLFTPILSSVELLKGVIDNVLLNCDGSVINISEWENGRYSPTPTIIEAALALYGGHSVSEISRSDASAINLRNLEEVSRIIKLF